MVSEPQDRTEFFFAHDVVGYFDEEVPSADGRYAYMPYRGPGHLGMQETLAKLGTVRCTYLAPTGPVGFEITEASEHVLVVRRVQLLEGRFAAWHPAMPQPTDKEHSNQDRAFYDILGPERPDVPCKRPDCRRGAIAQSVLCRAHHFEMIQGRPCPFDD